MPLNRHFLGLLAFILCNVSILFCQNESDVVVAMSGALILSTLLPCVPSSVADYLGDILEVFVRISSLILYKPGRPTFVIFLLFSKSVLDIRTRIVVTVKPETKWMPNSDSALKLVPKCKILCQYDLPNYFYSCLKIAVF